MLFAVACVFVSLFLSAGFIGSLFKIVKLRFVCLMLFCFGCLCLTYG